MTFDELQAIHKRIRAVIAAGDELVIDGIPRGLAKFAGYDGRKPSGTPCGDFLPLKRIQMACAGLFAARTALGCAGEGVDSPKVRKAAVARSGGFYGFFAPIATMTFAVGAWNVSALA